MKHAVRQVLILLLVLSARPSSAKEGAQQFAELGDLRLESGQVLRECRIGYRTFGRLNRERSNAVLFPTWFTGRTQDLVGLIGPGRLVDSSRHFVVCVDALGNGVSSSPSNSKSQGGPGFPRFSIRDMVNTQHQLLTRPLRIRRLHAVIGISMGGMQAFEWILAYPTFVRAAIPIVGTPRQTSADLLLWQSQLRLIEASRDSENERRLAMRMCAALMLLNLHTPAYHVKHTRPGSVGKLLEQQETDTLARDPEDWASQLRAMIGHDCYRGFGGSARKAAGAVRARVLVIVSPTDQMVNPAPSIEFARLARARLLLLSGPSGHMAPADQFAKMTAPVRSFLRQRPSPRQARRRSR